MFGKWRSAVKRLHNNTLSIQEFIEKNERKTLFYSTPFIEKENGKFPNVLQAKDSDVACFPVFTAMAELKAYMTAIGCTRHVSIKGNLRSVLTSLDIHPVLREWGVVVDPQSPLAVEIPPQIRPRPKCLRCFKKIRKTP